MNLTNKLIAFIFFNLFSYVTGAITVKAQTFKVDTIIYNGDPNKFINLVFMGDGYQSNQLSNFTRDAQSSASYLFAISPFSEYKNYFNVFAIRVPSIDTGTDHPRTASDCPSAELHPNSLVNTHFNSTFDEFSIHRLLVPKNHSAINSVIINDFPLYDYTMLLVNSPYYGGSGGSTATASLHPNSNEVLVHEFGHSFAGLSDEYYAGDFYAAESANMTRETNPALVKWKNWIGFEGVGIYQHCCGGNSALWYRPHNSCKMRVLGKNNNFCPVCKETIIEKIHQAIGSPITSYQPTQTNISYCAQPLKFGISSIKPIPNTLRVKWKLNGKDFATNIDSVTISSWQLDIGNNTLSVQVLDTTSLIRDIAHVTNHTYSVSWIIQTSVTSPTITASGSTTICQGNSLTLTASAANSYLWSNGATTQSIVVSASGSYSVTTKDSNGCSAVSLPTTVMVNTVDIVVNENGSTLVSNATAATYQWVKCPEMQILTGETKQNYLPTQSGSYAVIVTQNGCTNTSDCFPVTVTGLPYTDTTKSIVLYPNPTSEFFILKGKEINNGKYDIILKNNLGQILKRTEYDIKSQSLEAKFSIKEFSNGIYFLIINSKTINYVFKIQKQ